ncbi:hypothetical protein SEA_CRUNCHYBOI_51 [Microbacterium phage CrunchyBoi]|nr:hypothetical protein SEA_PINEAPPLEPLUTO_51 [Microbacterium phage PineapplePluto]QQO39394.1 hypothetical protein SEA_CRUNCHYBOI_51 [Microbacterium phage CrunchyBoi]
MTEENPTPAADEFVEGPELEVEDNGFKLPDDFEYDDEGEAFRKSPEFLDAVSKAEKGQYDHTMFESWRVVLRQMISVCEAGITMPFADGLLRQWPWLRYVDLEPYLRYRKTYLQEAISVLEAQFPKPEAELFAENVNDFVVHKDAYLDVIVAWTRLSNRWTDAWDKISVQNQNRKALMHAVTADVSALLINPRSGLIENLRNLAGFHDVMTDADGEDLIFRINAPVDETDVR